MPKINIKALSVNKAWQGKRYKTPEYIFYEQRILAMLPKTLPNVDFRNVANLHLEIEFGYSNANTDIDNGLKPFLDCLQKKYGFNDKEITKLSVKKVKVKKGDEYISFLFL